MWRLGFFMWRAWLYIKYGVPAGLVLWLIYLAQGWSVLFWIVAAVIGCVGLGMVLAVGEFRHREFGDIGRERIR
ncbi:hypothetical protein [Amycolatopsis vancoresmycina]|uniref:Uncharacterized protein n=1 Tax=Amycolatopsis vancoresmycina DSM 44592 TaxID=1292037 RepID=R1IIV0_9PSEU|nr:hypothetical protein [Amycolatopsis vancoresmycina]EOD70344.1 hypothetical protein H480_01472 [Amycolatopsis vancoresmycina DSM 44592]